jgi:hypothetical protein
MHVYYTPVSMPQNPNFLCAAAHPAYVAVLAAPNLMSGLNTKGVDKHRVGMYGILGPGGFTAVVFANTIKTAIKPMASLPTNLLVGVSKRAWGERKAQLAGWAHSET